jgi:alpha/beta superfamily hydrolase
MASPQQVSKSLIAGSAGAIEVAAHVPDAHPFAAIAVVAHPHPLFGGTMDNKVVTSMARAFTDAGAATWRFNFRGVGRTEGTHEEGRGETDDMLTVIRHVRDLHPGLPLWLCGFSFGGAVTLAASEQVSASEMILIAPAFQRLAHWQNARAGGVVPESTLIIHGENDETVPLADSLNWARPRNIPVAVVPGADHFFHQRLHIIKQIASRWLPARA